MIIQSKKKNRHERKIETRKIKRHNEKKPVSN